MEKYLKYIKNIKKETLLLGAIIILLFLTIIGYTYSWFSTKVEGNENAKVIEVKVAELKLKLTDTEILSLNNAMPGASVSKTFTVENTGNAVSTYDITIINVSTTFSGNDLVYTLTSTNNGGTKEETILPNTSGEIATNITIEAGVTQTYTLTVTFKETGLDQNIDQGVAYTGKLQIIPRTTNVAILGYVTDSNGNELVNKTVELHSDPITTTTDSNGYYEFGSLPVGKHTIYVKDGDTVLASKEITFALGTYTELHDSTLVAQTAPTKYVNIKVTNENTMNIVVEEATLMISEASGTLYKGGNEKELTISGKGYGILTCTSSNISKATCSISGTTLTITPQNAGTGTITLKESKFSKEAVYSFEVKETSVALSTTSGTGYVGGSNLTSTISGNNMGNLYCGTTNDQIATCSITDNTLTIAPVGEGNATITVREGNGNQTATYEATIKTTSLSLSSTSGTLYIGGSSVAATINGSNYGTLNIISACNTSVASCSLSGNTLTITPSTTPGTTSITIQESNTNKVVTYTVTVEYPTLANYLIANYSSLGMVAIPRSSVGNQNYSTTEYRFVGSSVSNYIRFNNENWQIIGVFETVNSSGVREYRVKIKTSSPQRTSVWHSSSANTWSSSTLRSWLNSSFLNNFLNSTAQNQIDYAVWYTGGVSYTSTMQTAYNAERSGGTVTDKVGLIYATDFSYASRSCYNSGTTYTIGQDNYWNSSCEGSNWMQGNDAWTMTPETSWSGYAAYVNSSGYIARGTVDQSSINSYPAVYLKSSVKFISKDTYTYYIGS